jgi:hypothetical protein
MPIEKSGTIILTDEEVRLVNLGTLPPRLANDWKLTLQEARQIVQAQHYQSSATTGTFLVSKP